MCLCSFTAPARSTNSHTHSYTGGRGRRARCQPAHQERHSASYPKRPTVFIRSAFSHIHSHHNETALRSNFRFSVLPGDNLTHSQSCGLNRQPSDYLAGGRLTHQHGGLVEANEEALFVLHDLKCTPVC